MGWRLVLDTFIIVVTRGSLRKQEKLEFVLLLVTETNEQKQELNLKKRASFRDLEIWKDGVSAS